ncbi:MAG: hypothetical protein GF355_03075 [Candidatus Eisenbacteria bacterium]|nr:hypothetical protein [Candidatus Eisenbacteria bacterium]
MRTRICLIVVIGFGLATRGSFALDEAQEVGRGDGITLQSPDDPPCEGTFLLNSDGSYENGYAWSGGGNIPPDYGAFAEGFTATGMVCGIAYFFTQTGNYNGQTIDVYLYDSDGTNPLNVLSVMYGVSVSPPAFWPNVSQHDVAVDPVFVDGEFFVGFWGDWGYVDSGWYCAADLNGPGGKPRTNIAPGVWPEDGWQDPSIIWDPTQSMGIGAYVIEMPTPVAVTTWGRIKSLY